MRRFFDLLHRASRSLVLKPLRKILIELQTPDSISILTKLANEQAATYISDHLLSENTMVFSNTQFLRNHFFSREFLSRPGMVLDLGVAEGHSTLQISANLPAGKKVHAFDAFEGLRDPWSKTDTPPHAIDLGGVVPPELQSALNVDCRVGWVEDTLPQFLREFPELDFALIHLDMDVYPPTNFVLKTLAKKLSRGCIVVFDDYFDFPGWQNHSHKALTSHFPRSSYEVVGVSARQLAIQVL